MSIMIVGDLHGQVNYLPAAIGHAKVKGEQFNYIIQVGDFGWYPEFRPYWNNLNPEVPLYWIDGNHEYFPEVPLDAKEPVEVAKNIFYVPRGYILELDGRRIACMGGASSVDKAWRVPGKSWFPEENISPEEVLRLDISKPVDLMIAHTPPNSIVQKHFDQRDLLYFGLPVTWTDPNALIIEQLWNKLGNPPLYVGHMHRQVNDGNVHILNIGEYVIV